MPLTPIANFTGRVSDKWSSTLVFAGTIGLALAILDYAADARMERLRVNRSVRASAQAAIAGFATGVTATIFLVARRHRRAMLRESLRKAGELNHQLRNALQVMMNLQHGELNEARREMLRDTVDAVEETLQELFPPDLSPTDREAA